MKGRNPANKRVANNGFRKSAGMKSSLYKICIKSIDFLRENTEKQIKLLGKFEDFSDSELSESMVFYQCA